MCECVCKYVYINKSLEVAPHRLNEQTCKGQQTTTNHEAFKALGKVQVLEKGWEPGESESRENDEGAGEEQTN